MSLCCFDWYCTRCLFGQLPFAKDSIADDQDVHDDTTDHDTDDTTDHDTENMPEDLFLFNGNHFTSSGKYNSTNSMAVSVNKSVNIGLINARSWLSCVEDVRHIVSLRRWIYTGYY